MADGATFVSHSSLRLKAAVKVPLIAVVLCLSACSMLRGSDDQDPQKILDKRLLGVSVGDFSQHFGPPHSRAEEGDGTLVLLWDAPVGSAPAGLIGPERRVCRLRLVADRSRRITAVTIVDDGDGLRRVSRCAEIFAAP